MKFIYIALLTFGLLSVRAAEVDSDFSIRIFDVKGGERTAGTMTVRIDDLMQHSGRLELGQVFTQTRKNGDVSTGIKIKWKEEQAGIHTFRGIIRQTDLVGALEEIEVEFQYKGTVEIIHSNPFHVIKIIPNKKL